jgi:hypothetical protein
MPGWTEQELTTIGQAEELKISTRRGDGTLRRYVTIWVVRTGDNLYVRSAYGAENPWFARARKGRSGRFTSGGIEREVTFEDAMDSPAAIDAAYHAKYDRYGPRIVGTVVGDKAAALTIRLVPAD